MFSLKGKKVVLTGAAGYFGTYFAESLLDAGADKVFMTDINEKYLKDLQNKLEEKYEKGRMEFFIIDQYDKEETKKIFEAISEKNNIDVLINNSFDFGERTGFNTKEGRVESATFDQLEKSFESGIYWPIQASQIFAKNMEKDKRGGSIINIGSMYSLISPNPMLYEGKDYINPPGYSIAKSAVLAFTRYAAAFYGDKNIRVNALLPGAIPNTEKKSTNSEQNKDDEFMQRLIDRTLLKRVGHPTDLTGAIVLLASDASKYMTGQSIVVDGGWVVT